MFHLARLTSSSSLSLSATIGYAMTGARAMRPRGQPGERDVLDRFAAPCPSRLPKFYPDSQQQRRTPASYRHF
jgi:hypothetical protein